MASKTVVFVHGMYMTPTCWQPWADYFSTKGYRALVPAWPGRDRPVAELRAANPDPTTSKLGLQGIVDAMTAAIAGLDEKPVLIGHSMGGLVVQLMLQKGLASAVVAVDTAPPAGVFTTQFSFLKANWGHITPFVSLDSPVVMGFERFQYAFVNDLPLAVQREAFETFVVPESRHVPRDALSARIDFSRPHAPLLFVAGSNDNIIPAALNRSNYRRYKATDSVVDYKEFPGRTHFIIGQDNWREVADFTLDWLGRQA